MNTWIKQSIELANSKGYLDNLFSIYPTDLGSARYIPEGIQAKIKKAFCAGNKEDLIKTLLSLAKFPINDPYIASLRKYPHLLEMNPETIKRIGKRLLSIDVDMLLELASQPKSPSRQFGNTFKNWLKTTPYSFLKKEPFLKYNNTAFLEGSDERLREFAVEQLGIKGLNRRPDFILKTKNKFIIGEAKFLTDYGGAQNNQFDGALKMAKLKAPHILGIAILDGIVWFKSNAYMHRTVKRLKGIAISALLLDNFIKAKKADLDRQG